MANANANANAKRKCKRKRKRKGMDLTLPPPSLLPSQVHLLCVIFRKFLSIASANQKKTPAELVLNNKYKIGNKIANGAFGQLR